VFRPRFVGAYNCQQKAWLKIKKHQEIVTLAIAKRDTVDRLLSKALERRDDFLLNIFLSGFTSYDHAMSTSVTQQF